MVTFFIPRTNVIESDEGFSVEVLGKTGLRYKEPNRTLWLDSEMLAGPAGLILYSGNMKREGSPETITLGTVDRDRIIENVRAAFRFRGFEIQVV
jgi:hypothetical protein